MFGAVQKDIQNAGRYKMEQRSTKPMHYPVCSIRKTWIQSDIFARILQGISLGHLTKFFPQHPVDLATGAVIHPHGVWSVEKITSYCSYTLLTFKGLYLQAAVCQAAVTKVFATISTGIKSIIKFSSHMMLLIDPLPISIMIPVIPLTLSTHPGKGSFQEAVTKSLKVRKGLLKVKVEPYQSRASLWRLELLRNARRLCALPSPWSKCRCLDDPPVEMKN